MPQDERDLTPGYYKTRLYSRGPFVPIHVWWQDGERDENGDPIEDDVLRCQWWPRMDNPFEVFELDPFEERGGFLPCNFFEPIDESEFQWLITLKTL